jgi:hypothetical protein
MKKVLGRYGNEQGHWVGDGFPVRSLFSYGDLGGRVSPFLLLDYAALTDSSRRIRGAVSASIHTAVLKP